MLNWVVSCQKCHKSPDLRLLRFGSLRLQGYKFILQEVWGLPDLEPPKSENSEMMGDTP